MQSSYSTKPGPVRLPLQTGASSFSAIATWPARIVLLATGAATGSAWLSSHAPEARLRIVAMVVQVLLLVFTLSPISLLAWLGILICRTGRAIRLRACDVLLDRESLRFDGGPASGERLCLDDLELGGCSIEDGVLYLALRDGTRRAVACATDADERDSLAVLLAAIRVRTGPRQSGPARGEGASLLCCAGCGAAVAPDERPLVECAHCGEQVTVPAPLRERLRALRQAAASHRAADRAVERLLQQPGAGGANLVILVGALALLVLWPVSTLLPLVSFAEAASASFLWLSSLLLGATLLILAVERVVIADRQALRAVVTGFAACAPERGAERATTPSRCRRCAAPLPLGPGVVVRCLFCGAANVLGVDVHAGAAAARSQVAELESVLSARRAARLRRGLALLAALGLAFIAWRGFCSASRAEEKEASGQPTCATLDAPPDPPGPLSLTAAAADLLRLSSDPSDEWDPTLSPDGLTLLITVSSGSGEAVAALPAGGGRIARLRPGRQPCWISGTDYWFVEEHRERGEPAAEALYRASYRTDLSQAAEPAEPSAAPPATAPHATGASVDSPTVSPDGSRVLFGHRFARSGNFGLRGFAPSGPISVFTGTTSPRFPAFSQRGAELAFTALTSLRRHVFVTAWSQPARARAITCGEAAAIFPVWSPQGDRIAFVRVEGSDDEGHSAGDLFTVQTDGRRLVQLTKGRTVTPHHITWGRDGYLYFSSRSAGTAAICRLRP